MITTKEVADKLTGAEYLDGLEAAIRGVAEDAKAAGIVIVHGASDDLLEFVGAIRDEVGAYEGTTVCVDKDGLIPPFADMDHDDEDEMRAYFTRERIGVPVKAIWHETGDTSWSFETAIPHETFEIMEDGEVYCRGIVFALSDVAARAAIAKAKGAKA